MGLSEWGRLTKVAIHRPGIEMFYGLLYPRAFLYEAVFSMDEALYEHENVEHVLAIEGVEVVRVKRTIVSVARASGEFRRILVERAVKSARFIGLGEDDEGKVLEWFNEYDPETLFNIIILKPTIKVRRSRAGLRAVITNTMPLANLYFTRDQQLVTGDGVIMGRMRMPQRAPEVDVMELFFKALGAPIKYRLARGFIEGGDFLPMGEFALLGYGPRSDLNGALMAIRHLGFDEVALVKIPRHPWGSDMFIMHLDTYVNALGDGLVAGNLMLMEDSQVAIYGKSGRRYVKVGETTLDRYLRGKGFNILKLTLAEQVAYASNFLTVADRKIIAPNLEMNMRKMLKRLSTIGDLKSIDLVKEAFNKIRAEGYVFPRRPDVLNEGIDFIEVDVSELVGGFGGIHCMTTPISRTH